MNGDKRKFLFVSISGLISDIAWQVAKEGHEVRYCIEDEKERDIADGFVPKVRDWQREVDWADVVVFDDTLGQGEKAQALRAKGNAVIGGTPVHGPARGRSLVRSGGAQEGGHQHRALPRFR